MSLSASITPHKLAFKFDAGTSRGILKEKQTYFLKLWDQNCPEVIGMGEAGPLSGLSPDDDPNFHEWLMDLCNDLAGAELPSNIADMQSLLERVPMERPAIKFALETALLDLLQGGKQVIFPSAFTRGAFAIPINGLVWMGDFDFMKDQVQEKVAAGYSCLKLKIGAIDFEQECELLQHIRTVYPPQLILRVDANGAFTPEEAEEKLNRLSEFNLHSIEQPLMAGQQDLMASLSATTILPIALDEELIGVYTYEAKKELLARINPQYIILKPTLIGGLDSTSEWIALAQSMGIGWWITSALESNVGLNAIAQYTAVMDCVEHQGLGTGQLYSNNVPSPLFIENGLLKSNPE